MENWNDVVKIYANKIGYPSTVTVTVMILFVQYKLDELVPGF